MIKQTLQEIWSSLSLVQKRYFSLALWILGLFGFISIFVLPKVFTLKAQYAWMRFDEDSSNVANTINGIATPFLALISALLTFLAFWVQYQANVDQRDSFQKELSRRDKDDKDRDKTWKTERFEGRFYELLKLHKANVDEMDIANNVSARKCFVPMFYELRYGYQILEKILKDNPLLVSERPDDFNPLKFVYVVFFFGTGSNSEKHFISDFNTFENKLYSLFDNKLEIIKSKYLKKVKKRPNLRLITFKSPNPDKPEDSVDFYYCPFDGHISRLGHYYRHLFQTVHYIIAQQWFTIDERYSYMKNLRAQLSNFEQLMLYYNAQAWFGNEWHQAFTDYRLIKNLPIQLADIGEKPMVLFKDDIERLRADGKEMFELHE